MFLNTGVDSSIPEVVTKSSSGNRENLVPKSDNTVNININQTVSVSPTTIRVYNSNKILSIETSDSRLLENILFIFLLF